MDSRPLVIAQIARTARFLLRAAIITAAVALAHGPYSAAAEPPGGIRPLVTELDGRWIGNGVSFGPFRRGQSPDTVGPSDAEILEDLRLVARHWNLIRMYDSSEVSEATLRLVRQHRLPVRMILGAWIAPEKSDAARAANLRQVDNAIRLANAYPDIVVAVNVGNETQVAWSWHPCRPEVLIGHLRKVRAGIPQPVTTADDYAFWNRPDSRAVAAEVDFIMMHAYALWNGRQLDEAMAWTGGVFDSVRRMHPDRQVILGETGWATRRAVGKTGSDGESTLMKAPASVAAQENYLRQHNHWVDTNRVVTLLFEAFDEPWKGGGPDSDPAEAEKNWGVFTESRKPKASLLAVMRERQPAVALLYSDHPLVVGNYDDALASSACSLPGCESALIEGGPVALVECRSGDAATCARLLRERDLVSRVIVQASDWNFLRELHALLPEQVIAAPGPGDAQAGRTLSPKEKILADAWLDDASDAGASVVLWHYPSLTADSVHVAHARGLRVWAHGVNDPSVVPHLVSIGVDGLVGKDPEALRKALNRPRP